MDGVQIDRLLPLGSVVRLEGVQGEHLIIGHGVFSEDGRLWDYALVGFPTGIVSSQDLQFASADMVDEVVAEGYEDERSRALDEIVLDVRNQRMTIGEAVERGGELLRSWAAGDGDAPAASEGS